MTKLVRIIAGTALAFGILVNELGFRGPAPPGAVIDEPRFLLPLLHLLRETPFNAISDLPSAAIVSGVVFGRTDQITMHQETAFLESGLWHLLAASGQNIALVAGCCIVLVRLFGGDRVLGAILALFMIPLYVLIVGGGASIIRAGIMGELALIAWLTGRMPDIRQLMLVSAALICWGWPGAHRGLGMQLSYACVLGLVLWASPFTKYLVSQGVPKAVAGGTAATIICGGATAPILAFHTDAAPITGAVTNLLAVPLAGAILVIGLAGAVLSIINLSAIGSPLLKISGLLAALLEHLAVRGASLPGAQIANPLIVVLLPILIMTWSLIIPRVRKPIVRKRLSYGTFYASTLLCLLALINLIVPVSSPLTISKALAKVPTKRENDVRIAVLDVGQGEATLIQTDQGSVLVDTGPPSGKVVQRIKEIGVKQIDGVILTHDSLDHRGGFESVLKHLEPSWVAKPVKAPGPWQRIYDLAPKIIELCVGDEFTIGEATLVIKNPPCDGVIKPRTDDLHNDGAIVVLLTHKNIRAVLPADAEAPVLVELKLPLIDLLRISHHGSSDPKLPQLLKQVQPVVAAISSGAGNSYGHPRPDVLRALKNAGVITRRTDQEGTIIFDSSGDKLTLR